MKHPARKVGRITVALGLVGLGTALLLDNLLGSGLGYTRALIRFWPVLLIGLGLEYLVFSVLERADGQERRPLQFDFGGAFLLFVVAGLTASYTIITGFISLNPAEITIGGEGAYRGEEYSVPTAGAKELVVDIDVGRVYLYSQSADEVRVEAEYRSPGWLRLREEAEAFDQFTVSIAEGETITVTEVTPEGINGGSVNAVYRVYAPAGLKVRIESRAGAVTVEDYAGELDLSTQFGSVSVNAASGSLKARTTSGTIRVDSFEGPVVASTNAGSIRLDRVAGAVELESGTGVIRVDEFGGGPLKAETNTGSIQVETTRPPQGEILLRTSAGIIQLELPEESDVQVTAVNKTGPIEAPAGANVTQSGASRSATLTLGQGTYPVTLEANKGSIEFDVN